MTPVEGLDPLFLCTLSFLLVRTSLTNRIFPVDHLNGKLLILVKSFHDLTIVFYKGGRIPFPFKPKRTEKMVRSEGNLHLFRYARRLCRPTHNKPAFTIPGR